MHEGQLDLPHETSQALRELLAKYGFDEPLFALLRRKAASASDWMSQNRLHARMEPPLAHDLVALPKLGSPERAQLAARGRRCIAEGRVAVVILAGGMATRFGGVVKACVELTPGMSFLELKLWDIARVAASCDGRIPVLLMSSFATDTVLQSEAARLSRERVPVQTFPQFVSLRLQPGGDLFRDASGQLSPYATGHGDLVPALQRAHLLSRLRQTGVERLFVTNIDNVAATLDPALVGLHEAMQQEMSFEVVPADPGDQGGTPARVEGVFQVVEALRQPPGAQHAPIPWFSTNCMYFSVRALQRPFPLDWFCVERSVEGRRAWQYERLMNQMTAFLSCKAVLVERSGDDARFLPVKSRPDLAQAQEFMKAVLTQR